MFLFQEVVRTDEAQDESDSSEYIFPSFVVCQCRSLCWRVIVCHLSLLLTTHCSSTREPLCAAAGQKVPAYRYIWRAGGGGQDYFNFLRKKGRSLLVFPLQVKHVCSLSDQLEMKDHLSFLCFWRYFISDYTINDTVFLSTAPLPCCPLPDRPWCDIF